jgi:DNA-binding FadR family transcriptional regulator
VAVTQAWGSAPTSWQEGTLVRQTMVDPFGLGKGALPEPESVPQRIRGAKLGTTVVYQLVNDIVRGLYQPGSTLPPEGELCDRFAVSRTVIRESLKIVQEKGLVNIAHGRGTQVADSRYWNLLDDIVLTAIVAHDSNVSFLDELVATRAALEADMAATAAGSHTEDDDMRITDALQAMQSSVGRVNEFAEADVHFHDMVMAASRNRLGRAIVNSIHDKARQSMRYRGEYNDAVMLRTVDEHQVVHDAILAGDAQAAAAAMRAHILGSWRRRRPVVEAEIAPPARRGTAR